MVPRAIATIAACVLLAGCGKAPTRLSTEGGTTYKVYYLGGQSNMDGLGRVDELPEGLAEKVAQVPIFHGDPADDGAEDGGVGFWQPLRPGHGAGYRSDLDSADHTERFGPELSFAAAMIDAHPDEKIALVKYSRGGTALVHGASGYGSWDPDFLEGNRRNQYDHALTAIDLAMAPQDIDGDGNIDRLVPAGIVWMQGESDAVHTEETARRYLDNLTRMMGYLRAAFRSDGLPVVIGKLKDSGDTPETRVMPFGPLVQQHQAAFVEADSCAALVKVTEGFDEMPDGWHFVSEDYLRLGKAFAQAMVALEGRC